MHDSALTIYYYSNTTISFVWYAMCYFCFLQIPLFQRGGSIIVTKQRIRRCSALMHNDPYTLTLALSPKVRADLFLPCILIMLHQYFVTDKQTNQPMQSRSEPIIAC